MSDDLLNRLKATVEMRGEGLDEDEVRARLAANYRAHAWTGQAPVCRFGVEADQHGDSEADRRFLRYQLEHGEGAVALELRPTGGPLVGRVLNALKAPLHQLVVYYVNLALARTNTTQMIQERLIASLQADVTRLEERLAAAEEDLRRLRGAEEGQ